MMIYAARIKATDNAVAVGAYNNKPLVPVYAFETVAEMRAMLDTIWQGADGDNLVRVSRKEVEVWFGKTFCIAKDGRVTTEYDEYCNA